MPWPVNVKLPVPLMTPLMVSVRPPAVLQVCAAPRLTLELMVPSYSAESMLMPPELIVSVLAADGDGAGFLEGETADGGVLRQRDAGIADGQVGEDHLVAGPGVRLCNQFAESLQLPELAPAQKTIEVGA